MKTKQLVITIVALMLATAAVASGSPDVAKTKLEKILACEQGAKPEEVTALAKTLGGVRDERQDDDLDTDYTLPNPIEVFGFPVKEVSIHPAGGDVDYFMEYGSTISGESIDTVAKRAGVTHNSFGSYQKKIGNRDLSLIPIDISTNIGASITCMNDIRTVTKTSKRAKGQ